MWRAARPYLAAVAFLGISGQATISQYSEYAQLRAGLHVGEDNYIRHMRGAYKASIFPGKDIFQNRIQQQIGALQFVGMDMERRLEAMTAAPEVTGSVDGKDKSKAKAAPGPLRIEYPAVDRTNKGDRLVRRDGKRLVLRADPRTGGIMKIAVHRMANATRPDGKTADAAYELAAHSSAKLPDSVAKVIDSLGMASIGGGEKKVAELSEERSRELMCLAKAVYFEARGESEPGQVAVAQVVMNRVENSFYPDSICGVVFQNEHQRNRCQFSFACDGQSDRPLNKTSWERSIAIAKKVMNGHAYDAKVGKATHYHADYVRPRWARSMTQRDVIGRHIFYTAGAVSQ